MTRNLSILAISVLVLVLSFSVQSSWSLRCRICNDVDVGCKIVNCNGPEEMCIKEVIHGGSKDGQRKDFIKKGCKKYELEEPLNSDGCQALPNLMPPFPGIRCWCNDKDFCNASGQLFKNSFLTSLILGITILPIISAVLTEFLSV